MKRVCLMLLAAVMCLLMTGCAGKTSTGSGKVTTAEKIAKEAITMDLVIEKSVIGTMLEDAGGFVVQVRNNDEGNLGYDAGDIRVAYKQSQGVLYVSQTIAFDDGYVMYIYYDSQDPNMYVSADGTNSITAYDLSQLDTMKASSLFGYENYDCDILSITEDGDTYVLIIQISQEGVVTQIDEVVLDAFTGKISSVSTEYQEDGNVYSTSSYKVTYSADTAIDTTAKENNK